MPDRAGRAARFAVVVACAFAVLAAGPPAVARAETVWPEGVYPPEALSSCPAGGAHDFHATIVTPATEDNDGVRLFACSKCGLSFEGAIPHTGHEWGPWIVDVAPTCTSTGQEHRECHRYEAEGVIHYDYGTLPALSATGEHTWVETDRREPTATEDGWVLYTCSVCGATRSEALAAAGEPATPEAEGPAETPDVTPPVAEAPAPEAEPEPEPETEPESEQGPGFWSFEPNAVDVTMLAGDGIVVALTSLLLLPLAWPLLWLRRRRRSSQGNLTDEVGYEEIRRP
jgi:hypothetical protein